MSFLKQNIQQKNLQVYCENNKKMKKLFKNKKNIDGLRRGWFILVLILIFMLPVIMAVVGAIVAGNTPMIQFLGAISGLSCGIISSVVFSKFLLRLFSRFQLKSEKISEKFTI